MQSPDDNLEELVSIVQGIATRKSIEAAIKVHIAVLKGKALRKAIADALSGAEKLSADERRFVAFAASELSRHLRRIDLSIKARGFGGSDFQLTEDRALFQYSIWRRDLTRASVDEVLSETKLPGPVRPRSLADAFIAAEIAREVIVDFGDRSIDRLANLYSFPTWLVEKIAASVPESELESLLRALNVEPGPLTRSQFLATVYDATADVVMIQPPCSNTGMLGREPDQKWRLTPKRISELCQNQLKLLSDAASKMKPGTVLIYGTSSVLADENESVVGQFSTAHPNFVFERSFRIGPNRHESGGFFAARWHRR